MPLAHWFHQSNNIYIKEINMNHLIPDTIQLYQFKGF